MHIKKTATMFLTFAIACSNAFVLADIEDLSARYTKELASLHERLAQEEENTKKLDHEIKACDAVLAMSDVAESEKMAAQKRLEALFNQVEEQSAKTESIRTRIAEVLKMRTAASSTEGQRENFKSSGVEIELTKPSGESTGYVLELHNNNTSVKDPFIGRVAAGEFGLGV